MNIGKRELSICDITARNQRQIQDSKKEGARWCKGFLHKGFWREFHNKRITILDGGRGTVDSASGYIIVASIECRVFDSRGTFCNCFEINSSSGYIKHGFL